MSIASELLERLSCQETNESHIKVDNSTPLTKGVTYTVYMHDPRCNKYAYLEGYYPAKDGDTVGSLKSRVRRSSADHLYVFKDDPKSDKSVKAIGESLDESMVWRYFPNKGSGYNSLELNDTNNGVTHTIVKNGTTFNIYASGWEDEAVIFKATSYEDFVSKYKSKYGFGTAPSKDVFNKLK